MKTTADEPKNAHAGCQCQALARTVTISNDAVAALDRLMSSLQLVRISNAGAAGLVS